MKDRTAKGLPHLSWNRHSLHLRHRSLEVLLYVSPQRAGILIRVSRLHVLHNEKIDKINRWLGEILPRGPQIEVSHNDAHCLAMNVPGPSGVFWWCLQP